MTADGEFRFPPALNPSSYNELKYNTLWELEAETPIHEIFGDARHVSEDDADRLADAPSANCTMRGYLTVVARPWDSPDDSVQELPDHEARRAFHRLRTLDAWQRHGVRISLVPTEKWRRWAEVEKS
jgi:hypothetical protein